MVNRKGQFKKGQHASPATEFKPGQHWREPKPYWDREWLYKEYVVKQRSAGEIARDFGCYENNILYFLEKHGIPRRSHTEARRIRRTGSCPGPKNGMYGRRGKDHPNWKGGVTPERQALYSSLEWREVVRIVWDRDQGVCQRCGIKKQEHQRAFHMHHIVPFSNKELRTDPTNVVLLCTKCHGFVHSQKNTEREFLGD